VKASPRRNGVGTSKPVVASGVTIRKDGVYRLGLDCKVLRRWRTSRNFSQVCVKRPRGFLRPKRNTTGILLRLNQPDPDRALILPLVRTEKNLRSVATARVLVCGVGPTVLVLGELFIGWAFRYFVRPGLFQLSVCPDQDRSSFSLGLCASRSSRRLGWESRLILARRCLGREFRKTMPYVLSWPRHNVNVRLFAASRNQPKIPTLEKSQARATRPPSEALRSTHLSSNRR